MRHATGVLAWAEDGKAVVGGAKGFDAFVGLLPVVEARSHAVNGEVGRTDEGWGAPLRGLNAVVGFDVTVYWGKTINR